MAIAADGVAAQGWDATVTAAVTAVAVPEVTPLLPLSPKRPIPVRQARGLAGPDAQPAPATGAHVSAAVGKPPIWTTAANGPPAGVAAAEPPSTAALPAPAPPAASPPAPRSNFVRQYCVNVADATADARFAWQRKTLADLEQELDKRMVLLEAKAAETRDWLTRRDEFARKARDGLVLIYARMRPDAAAAQLAAMDEETAAAVINRLEPRNASGIMSEMEPAKAARLTSIIAGAARTPNDSGAVALKEKRS
ncbi:MAG TPA: MotE family protein [Hyphomicrobiaceae bacterium]|nr:MotE family protein [Hyphomicrobiaceae bacterium]